MNVQYPIKHIPADKFNTQYYLINIHKDEKIIQFHINNLTIITIH